MGLPTPLIRSTPGRDLIRQEIEKRGPLTFREFMDISLYHPLYGYYSQSKVRRGKQGDYFTSSQVSTLYAEIWAEAFIEMRKAIGADHTALIEMGAGGGEFMEAVLDHFKRRDSLKGWKVWAVETSRHSRDQLWRRLSRFPRCEVVPSLDEIEWVGSLDGIIFSNEFFDALPFHRLKFSGGEWKEVMIGLEGEALVEKLGPLSRPDLAPAAGTWEENQEIEIRPGVDQVYEKFNSSLGRGYVMTVDYGHPRSQLQSPRRPQGTWQGFHKHKATQDLFAHIGDTDITAHADFTQLAEAGRAHDFEPLFFSSQGLFLTYAGQTRIQERIQEKAAIQQLIHPDAMGEAFWVLGQGKGIEWPAAYQEVPNRLARLFR